MHEVSADVRDRGSQVDVLVVDAAARIAHQIECKWGREDPGWLDDQQHKPTTTRLPDGYCVNRVLACGYPTSQAFIEKAKSVRVTVLSLEELAGA
jgi:hypothetical protein